jgi:hypothetical protein
MARLIEELTATLTGVTFHPPSTDQTIGRNIDVLVRLAGSGRAAARALGVAESTFRGWRHGVQPRSGQQAIVSTARRLGALNTGQLAYALGDGSLTIRGIIRVSRDVRERTVHPGRHIPSTTMARILRRWAAAEDDSKVERSLMRAIDHYYQPLDFQTITGVWFE